MENKNYFQIKDVELREQLRCAVNDYLQSSYSVVIGDPDQIAPAKRNKLNSYNQNFRKLKAELDRLLGLIVNRYSGSPEAQQTIGNELIAIYQDLAGQESISQAERSLMQSISKVLWSILDAKVLFESTIGMDSDSLPGMVSSRLRTESYPRIYLALYSQFVKFYRYSLEKPYIDSSVESVYWEVVSRYMHAYLPSNVPTNAERLEAIYARVSGGESSENLLSLEYLKLSEDLILTMEESVRLMLMGGYISVEQAEVMHREFALLETISYIKAVVTAESNLEEDEVMNMEAFDLAIEDKLIALIASLGERRTQRILRICCVSDEDIRKVLKRIRAFLSTSQTQSWSSLGSKQIAEYLQGPYKEAVEIVAKLSTHSEAVGEGYRGHYKWASWEYLSVSTRKLYEAIQEYGSVAEDQSEVMLALVEFLQDLQGIKSLSNLEVDLLSAFYSLRLKPVLVKITGNAEEVQDQDLIVDVLSIVQYSSDSLHTFLQYLEPLSDLFKHITFDVGKLNDDLKAMLLVGETGTENEDAPINNVIDLQQLRAAIIRYRNNPKVVRRAATS